MSLIISPNQEVLVSGTNIKTINNTSLLGEGDYDIITEVFNPNITTCNNLAPLALVIVANQFGVL